MSIQKSKHRSPIHPLFAAASLSLLLSACGGGSSDVKSAVQSAFEAAALKTGSGYNYLNWTNDSTGFTSLFAIKNALPSSPFDATNKTVQAETTATSLSANLAVPASFSDGSGYYSTVVDENGALAKALVSSNFNITYDGDKVIWLQKTITGTQGYITSIDSIAATSLTGTVIDGMKKLFPTLTSTDVDSTNVFSANAAYYEVKFSRPRDQMFLHDWDNNSTTDPGSVTAIGNGAISKIEDAVPYTSSSDGVTYQLADGDISTYNGKRIWVAKTKRPATATPRTAYRVFIEVAGVVYTGAIEKQGSIIKRRPVGAPTDGSQDVDYFLFWNDQAIADMKSAVKF